MAIYKDFAGKEYRIPMVRKPYPHLYMKKETVLYDNANTESANTIYTLGDADPVELDFVRIEKA